jgi:hypothetical protein
VHDGTTAVERSDDRNRLRWWTFAGARANGELAARLTAHKLHVTAADDLALTVVGPANVEDLRKAAADPSVAPAPDHRLEAVKFHEAVPVDLLGEMVVSRDADPDAVAAVNEEPIEAVAS